MKILIADDNADNRRLLRQNLEHYGCEVVEAADGLEGLDFAHQYKPDVIISDALMPNMDGFKFLRESKQDSKLKSIPFIFYTSTYIGAKEAELAISLGAEAYIVRPKEPDELWEEIKVILENMKTGKEKTLTAELIEEDKDFLKRYCEIVAEKLEQKVTELENAKYLLNSVNIRLDKLLTTTPAVIYSSEPSYPYTNTFISDNITKLTGYTVEEHMTVPKFWAEHIHPEDAERVFSELSNLFEKDYLAHEYRFRFKDGNYHWMHDELQILRDSEGEPQEIVGFLIDISERKMLEEERERLLWWKEGVNLLQRSLLAPATQDQKLKSITDNIVRLFDADFCRIWLIRPGDLCEQGCIHAKVQEGPHVCHYRDRCLHLLSSSGRYTHIDGKVHRRVPFGCYKIGQIASGKEHKFLTNDAQNDPHIHNREWARELGLVSFAGYQLHVPDGQPIGVLALFAKHPISAFEDSMLDGLSNVTAMVIQQTSAEEELKKSEEFNRTILESVDEGFIVIDPEYRIISANRAYCEQAKCCVENIIGKHCYEVSHHIDKPCFQAGEECAALHTLKTGNSYAFIHTHYDKAGAPVYVETKSYPIKDASGNVIAVIETTNNITEKRRLEEQLRHTQKMEAVGTLAGGIAHDFNNMLNVIIGYGGIIEMGMKKDDPFLQYLKEMLAAGEKAAQLTKGLLILSRKQAMHITHVNINEIVNGFKKMIGRIIGEDVELKITVAEEDLIVKADAGHIEQVLMNLSVNAKDAMPKGGRLTIETRPFRIDNRFLTAHGYGELGEYALITVSDTGTGMDEAIKEKIFEPYFTTKEIGRGTGLGLSIVYGIVKEHNGYIECASELGKGTTFRIYLPLAGIEAEEIEKPEAVALKGGNETILIAEDDSEVRNYIKQVLEDFGYKVIEAVDGEDVVNKFKENKDSIHLILFDVIMPRKNSREAYEDIKGIKHDIKAVFISGYTLEMVQSRGFIENGFEFISKPVIPNTLLRKVREVLDR